MGKIRLLIIDYSFLKANTFEIYLKRNSRRILFICNLTPHIQRIKFGRSKWQKIFTDVFLWDLQIFRFANGLISIKEGKSLPSVSRYNADRQEINAATHASSTAKLLLVLLLLLLVRLPSVTVKCKRDRSTHRRHVGTPFYSSYTPRSPYISGARSLCSELWPVVPVFG